ncbi:MAG: PH domain-containing protein [Muribaculaceae bacterium]|nr:PH domain-containing protein [Muribaculaceae bacterium]
MKKYYGTKYNSQWDVSTWTIIALVVACCLVNLFLDEGIAPLIICLVMLVFVVTCLLSISYRIDGNNLVVYQFFIPKTYPIDKIKEIKPTKMWLSAPATSIKHRLAIEFTDRSILKSTIPLIISPARQEEFIQQLLSVNPAIKAT